MHEAIEVSIHEGRGGQIPNLESAWTRLLAEAPEHQQLFSFHWYASWYATVANGRKSNGWTGHIRVLAAYGENGRPLAMLPLAYKREYHLAWWSLAGNTQPLRGFVCLDNSREATCKALAKALVSMLGWQEVLRFGPFDTLQPERKSLVDELHALTSTVLTFDIGHRLVMRNVPQGLDQYRKLVASRESFKRVAYYERKLERNGKLEIRYFHNPVNNELDQLMEHCRTVEQASWLRTSSHPHFRFSGTTGEFWARASADALSPNGQLDAWIAYLDERPIALRFCLTTGTIRFIIANQYDEQFSEYALGWVLYLRDLKNCAERGIRLIDMETGTNDYKKRWGGVEEGMATNVFILPNHPMGWLGSRIATIPAVRRRVTEKLWGR